ncbi:hypothetical protein TL16_g11929 [Triparma laevis f. inornata]|uniref:PLC-like phosphodiesterase n=1 Tax=Triparma laevis f. inornata TaxID=1714386 RepID=A0A9W7EUX3_9STRA|nr:hypothetical protein TL16_g11929 [Triparma laevis f. inornata]
MANTVNMVLDNELRIMPKLPALILLVTFATTHGAVWDCDKQTSCATCTGMSHLLDAGSPTSAGQSENPQHLEGEEDEQLGTQLIGCNWCPDDNSCHAYGSLFNKCSSDTYLKFPDVCPTDYPSSTTPDFLPDWMGSLNAVLGNLTVLDLSLPGTHDSLTYDLSTTVSDGGIDDYPELSKILNLFSGSVDIIPGQIEDFIRQQARTQGLTITQQLDNGVRFIDFRQIKEGEGGWYSLHCLESNNLSFTYLKEIKEWLQLHPQEVVVAWITKHGNGGATGDDAYPGVKAEDKQAYWSQVVDLFSDLIIDTTVSSPNSTSLNDLIARSHRFIPYLGDYEEFASDDLKKYALDGSLVDNQLGSSVETEVNSYQSEKDAFSSAAETKKNDKLSNRLYLRSMATSSPGCQIEAAAYMKFDPFANSDDQIKSCTSGCFDIPSLVGWCPTSLMDVAQMGAYYKQLTLEMAYNNFDQGWEFPNAIYLDSLDVDGTIRVGTTLPWGVEKDDDVAEHKTSRYPYADTLIGFNVKLACKLGQGDEEKCTEFTNMIDERRKVYEIEVWDDGKYGRSKDWPQ